MTKGKYHVNILVFVTFIVLGKERRRGKAEANGKIEKQKQKTSKQIKIRIPLFMEIRLNLKK